MMHTVESLEKQLKQIDGMLKDCEGKKSLDRLVNHLRERRETTNRALEQAKTKPQFESLP